MEQSTFRKTLTATGLYGKAEAEIVVTVNHSTKLKEGTHAGTHDDYKKNIPVHRIVVNINGAVWKAVKDIESEDDLISTLSKLLEVTKSHINWLVSNPPAKTFGDRITEILEK